MNAENDAAFRLLDVKWQVELDGTDISHTVEHIRLNQGTDATARLGISVPTGITQTSIDPVHHRMLRFPGGRLARSPHRRQVRNRIQFHRTRSAKLGHLDQGTLHRLPADAAPAPGAAG